MWGIKILNFNIHIFAKVHVHGFELLSREKVSRSTTHDFGGNVHLVILNLCEQFQIIVALFSGTGTGILQIDGDIWVPPRNLERLDGWTGH